MTALLEDIDVVEMRGDPSSAEISSIEFDSRRVGPGALFCCVPGTHSDGHLHAADAVDRGAVALLCDHLLDVDVVQARVPPGDLRTAMAALASAFYGHPSRSLRMVGVTGTNGKTTVTHLVSSVLERAGMPTGIVGTLLGERTTPEAPDLQRRLAAFRDDGHQAVAMEVSSHALAQHRVDAIVFDVAAFTNLSRDHLDHHGSMEAYFRAKATLFEPARSRTAVIAVDDPWGARLASELARTDVVPVRWNEATGIVTTVGSTSFRWRGRSITLPLTGRFNVANALVAATVATVLGVDEDTVAEGLAAVAPVPGRMEVVAAEDPFSVIVDYAHSPAGLEVALRAARHVAGPGRVICLFGCGGDRDAGKRPQMGEVASLLSDVVVITSDNPRSEDPAAIIDQIRPGLRPGAETVVEPDRAAAIGLAIGTARPGDVVLLAGKGHETTQSTAGLTVPFDDRMEARRALARGPGGNPA